MRTSKLRQMHDRSRLTNGILSNNPVLIGGLGLPFAVMLTVNLQSSVWMSVVMASILIPTTLLAYLIGIYLSRWMMLIVCGLFSMGILAVVVPMLYPFAPSIFEALGIYLYLASLNTLLGALWCRHGLRRHKALYVLTDALGYSLGFGAVMCILGAIREFFGWGSLWGIPIQSSFRLSGLQYAFAGFLLIGFLSALLQWGMRIVRIRVYREDNPEWKGGRAS